MNKLYVLPIVLMLLLQSCRNQNSDESFAKMISKADVTLEAIFHFYAVNSSPLLHENYPPDDQLNVTYLGQSDSHSSVKGWAYLWPYSGVFSAVNALIKATDDKKYHRLLKKVVLPGLDRYYDDSRVPPGFSSFTDPNSDRFYDDNIWLGIEFIDRYKSYKDSVYLEKAKSIWSFVWSGFDTKLGGGIYWHEQSKNGKNTCSNAPAVVLASKLYLATNDSSYLTKGTQLYRWTQSTLQDPADKLYFDNMSLTGRIDSTKYTYNSGQMIQAASLLYKITKKSKYLDDAKEVAESCFQHFFKPMKNSSGHFRMVINDDVWFTAVMLRGFIELYHITNDDKYIVHFRKGLDYAWEHARDKDGLFSTDWTGEFKNVKKWLLTQAAMVEMYANMATLSQ